MVESVERRTILLDAWSDLPQPIPFDVYSIEEIAAEKVRCIIQRVQCRDLYDIFRLVEDAGVSLADIRPFPSPISDRGSNARQRPKESTPHRSKSDSMIDWTGTRGVG